jgi:hypothetical protein
MSSKAARTTAILVLTALMLWGIPATQAQSPGRVSPSSGSAGPLAPTAVVVYSQPPSPSGGILLSSLRDPDGSDTDQWAWDGFRFARTETITEIRWRGGYDPARLGSGGPVFDFTIEIYPSTAADTQPDIAHPPLADYEVGNNADETAADVLGGVQTYDYRYILPAPFQATAGTKYWVQIEAFQSGPPDWGLSAGTGGDGSYFRRIPSQGASYQVVAGDAAFALLALRSEGPRLYLPMILKETGG